jgi:tetratricopeptide (TPR) repeat protein
VTARIVAGRFELGREAGAGGMGTVYCARDLTDGTPVAVKILHGQETRDIQRFDLEASILAELAHPAIVRYLAHGVAEGGDRYLAMEWLEGTDLAGRLERDPLSMAESVFVARRTAEALAYAHPRGIIHRDIKPENLFLPGGDIARLKVLDFGIARLTQGGRKLTMTGSVIGTPGYMAPELVRGERDITPAADVFSLGCVLFQCLTGRPVFEAEEATALLAKILLQDAPHVREVAPHLPDSLDRVVASMLAKDPRKRLGNAQEVIEALDGLGAVDEGVAPINRRRARPALTASEQRIACVVIAGRSSTAERRWRGETMTVAKPELGIAPPLPDPPSRFDALEADLVRIHGARVHPLPDGSMVLTLSDAGKATDQAARAARCALAVRAAIPDVPLVVSTGPGRFSAWSVVGEVIDSGMRLLRCTPPGLTRIDDMAAGLLDARFDIIRDGNTFFLRGERDVFEAKRNLLGKATDFVGRGREISMLTNQLAGAVTESMASAVLVTGAAGVGKSRLRQEFLEWVQRRPQRTEVLFGVGDSLGAGSPFAMLGRAIRRAAGIQEGEPLELRRRKLSERVGRAVARETVARVTAFLGEIANVPFSDDDHESLRVARQNPQLMGDSMRRAFEDWLAAECAQQPVLIVLEDLHWGDLGTVSFIDAALRNLREQPFMVLAMARPDVTTRFPNLWEGREMQTLRLAPLNRRASEKLVREALGPDISDALVAQLVTRADGNAFYLEELIRAAADGRCESLPDSVIGMVQARLDAEGGDAKRVLRAASVFGERFSKTGVAALLGGEAVAADVDQWLVHLGARELVARAATAERQGEEEYTFSHALVREAAYSMLTDDDRALGHRLAGDWLEQAGSSDAMALAEHFRRGEELHRSIRWYQLAAEQALKANDLSAAIERAELGLTCGAVGEVAGGLRLIQAEGHVWRGEYLLAEQRAHDASLDLAPGSAAWLRAQGQAIVAAAKHGQLEHIEERVRSVREAIPEFGARSAQVMCLSWAANYLIFGGRYKTADELIATIAELAGDLSEIDLQAVALVHQVRSVRASVSGDLGACLGGMESALLAFEQGGDLRNACTMRANMGYVYSELGDFDRADTALRQALSAADRMGLRELGAAILHNLGRVLGLRGFLDEAKALEIKAIESFGQQGDPRLEGVSRVYLAEIFVAAGDFASADREASAAVDMLTVAPALRVVAQAIRARALLGQGQTEAAFALSTEAIAALEALGDVEEGESSVRLIHAECLAARGAQAAAISAIIAARTRLLARAARIGEAAWRQRFLADVPSNARVLSLADSWEREARLAS